MDEFTRRRREWVQARRRTLTEPMRAAFQDLSAAFEPYEIPLDLWNDLSMSYSAMLRYVIAREEAPGRGSPGGEEG